MNLKIKNQKGITLVDALVSLVILGMGFLMILAVIPSTANLMRHSENRLLAQQIAQTYLELYSNPQKWDALTTGLPKSGTENFQTTINGNITSSSFSWSASSSKVYSELYNLYVTVTWNENYMGKGRTIKQIELVTTVVKPN